MPIPRIGRLVALTVAFVVVTPLLFRDGREGLLPWVAMSLALAAAAGSLWILLALPLGSCIVIGVYWGLYSRSEAQLDTSQGDDFTVLFAIMFVVGTVLLSWSGYLLGRLIREGIRVLRHQTRD